MSTEQAKHTPGPWVTGRDDMQSYHGLTGQPFSSVYRDADDARCPMTPDGFGGTTRVPLRIATIEGEYIERDEEKANARLIAAAPDLLAECEAVIPMLVLAAAHAPDRKCVDRYHKTIEAVHTAIARAKGGAA